MEKKIITAQTIVNLMKTKVNEALKEKTLCGKEKIILLDRLNITWFDRKLRLESNDEWFEGIKKALNRTYADVTIANESITFSEDIDQKCIDCIIEFICPSNNIKILEYAMSLVKMQYVGKAIELTIEDKIYTLFLSFNNMSVGGIAVTAVGTESMIASIGCQISLMPKVATYGDYKVSFSFDQDEDDNPIWLDTPLNEFSADKSANQKNVPYQNAKFVGTRNVSVVTMWGLSFWALNTVLSEKVTAMLLDDDFDMDQPLLMRIQYKTTQYDYQVKFASLGQKLTNNDYVLTSATLTRHSSKVANMSVKEV